MKKLKLTQHSDGGHSWLAVKRSLLKELGILEKISSCSYQRGETVYLEEDCDAGIFFHAYTKASSLNLEMLRDYFEITNSYKDRSPVRNYASFTINKVSSFTEGQQLLIYGKSYTVASVNGKDVRVSDEQGNVYKLKESQKDDCNNVIDTTQQTEL